MLSVAIIGYGKMGQIRASALEASGRATISGVYDEQMSDDCPYHRYPSAESAYQDPDVHAVFVCTPNYWIAPLCAAALDSGKHVFAEKPPAFNSNQLEQVREVEATTGKVLMYGFNHRHHGSVQRMKSIIDSGKMGRCLWMRGRYGKEVDESFFDGWRADKRLAGGGIMLDQGIHMLDLLVYLGGGFDEVQAMVSNLFWKIDGIEDNVFAQFRSSETGVCASLHSTMTQWRYLFSLEIFLEKGALILNGLKTSSGAYGDEELTIKHNVRNREQGHFEAEERIIYTKNTSWASEVDMFIHSVNERTTPPLGNSNDASAVMKLMDEIYAAETRSDVESSGASRHAASQG